MRGVRAPIAASRDGTRHGAEPPAAEIRACSICAPHLPLGPKPIFQLSATARLLITSQAPGARAHASGIPFDDPSGDRLRDWLGLDRAAFYDASRVAILPVGLCYPGRLPRGGDAPPRPECAPHWHPRVLPTLRQVRLRLLVGSHAIRLVLGKAVSLEEAVRGHTGYLPELFPLPHPSWRTRAWAKRHPWFETEVLPRLRREVARALSDAP